MGRLTLILFILWPTILIDHHFTNKGAKEVIKGVIFTKYPLKVAQKEQLITIRVGFKQCT